MSRTAIALPLGLLGFAGYVMVVVALADAVRGAPWPVELGYFMAAGLLWVIPARRLLLWAGTPR